MNNTDITQIATQVRRDILRMVHGCNSGHPGGSLGAADLLTLLYFEIMDIKLPFEMNGKEEDIFFLSNGHISPLFYSILARRGYFDYKELATFRRLNSRLQGHPTNHDNLPGVRISSGSLGQGLSVAAGAALAKRMDGDPKNVYVLCGDGELQEGQIWEAALFAAHYKLSNLIAFVDWNGQQIDGSNEDVISLGDLSAKWKSFGWDVQTVEKGNDIVEIRKAILIAKENIFTAHPKIILLKTKMGKGVDFMEGTHHWHGIAPNDEQLKSALLQLPSALLDY